MNAKEIDTTVNEFDNYGEEIKDELTLIELVTLKFTQETYTAYGMHKVVNGLLKDLDMNKVLPPQMFYNYASKGFIKSVDKQISKEECIRWTSKYLAKIAS